MINKQKILAFTMLLLIFSLSSAVFATDVSTISGEKSGEVSGEIGTPATTTEPNSGEKSGENVSEPSQGELSGETSGETTLKSIAQSSSISTYKNTSVTSTLHSDVFSGESDLRYIIEVQPSHGTLLFENPKVSTFTYTPDKDYIGTDSFSFKLTNGTLSSNVAMVTITVIENPTNIIPFNYVDMHDHWANYSASHLAARSIIVGEEIGNRYYFNPNNLVTRKDFMLYLLAITESNKDANTASPNTTFEDEKIYPSWLLEAAKLAYSKGIIKGTIMNNKLYLNLYENLTRSQAAVMINNVLKASASSEELTFKDTNDIPSWAISSIKALSAYKIMQGDGEYIRPNSIITKAEAGELCYKLLKQLESDEWHKSSSGDLK